jgi:uncharacterized protein YggE
MKHRLIILLGLLVLLLPVSQISAQEAVMPANNTITVFGTGQAFGSPDMASVDIGVETVSQDVSEAFNQTNTTLDAVISAIAQAGVAREDVRTSSLDVFLQQAPPQTDIQTEYRVANRINVTIRAIDNIEAVINAAVQAGANTIFGLNFRIADQSALESEARSQAISDARARAEEIASLIGAELGDVVNVVEGQGFGVFPFASTDAMGGAMSNAVIETGQLTVSTQLQVTYQILR